MNSSSEKNETFQTSELQENLEILRQIDFFAGLPLERLKLFAFISTRETFKPGEHMFRQEEDDGHAFYLISGRAGLIRMQDGNEETISEFEKGEFLGGMALLGNMHRLFSLRAITEVTCLILSREKFSSTIQQFPELMPKIFKSVVERINSWEGQFLTSCTEGCDICRRKVGVSLV